MNSVIIAARTFTDSYNNFFNKIKNRIIAKASESVLRNLDVINSFEGAKTSAVFEKQNLLHTPTFKNRKDLFKHCLDAVSVPGMYLEFGTYKGNSINIMAKYLPQQQFYGFDSFEGLPENWTPGCRKGAFSLRGKLPIVRKNVTLVKGFFEVSLPAFVAQHKDEKLAFIHIDCDLYSSTKTILELLQPNIVVGTIICFDEYYNYSDWQDAEYKAFSEFATQYNIGFKYIGYIRLGAQVAVRIESR